MPERRPIEDVLGEGPAPAITEPISTPKKASRKAVYIPLDSEGNLDLSRVKDPTKIAEARKALEASKPPEPEKPQPQPFPRHLVPPLYDLIAGGISLICRLVKFPRVFDKEQREIFLQGLRYSDEFKQQATEPTAKVIEDTFGHSKLAAWILSHAEAALLIKMFAEETQKMFIRAALDFNQNWPKYVEARKAAMDKANGTPRTGSENRGQDYDPNAGVGPPI